MTEGTSTVKTGAPPVSAQQLWWVPAIWFGVLWLACYGVVLGKLVKQSFTDADMSHAVFVPVLVGYVIHQRWAYLRQAPTRRNLWGLVLLSVSVVMACVGPPSLPTFASITRLSMILSLLGLLLYLHGTELIRRLAYPLALACFMIPIPSIFYERITLPLQLLASILAEHVLEGIGISVFREGNILHSSVQTLAVAEACSGLRSLMSLWFLGQAYVYMFDTKAWMRLWAAIVIVPLAVFGNAGRIVLTAILGRYNKAWTEGIVHESTAWVIFVIAFIGLILVHMATNKFYTAYVKRRTRRV